MKVLFIDDERLIRQGLQVIIDWEALGFDQFIEAENGATGLALIEQEAPDLILLDIRMNDMEGIEVAKRARDHGFQGRIIIISGYSDFEYAKSAITSDVTDYLLKPVDPEELHQSVEKAIRELVHIRLLSIYNAPSVGNPRVHILQGLLNGSLTYNDTLLAAYQINLSGNYFRLVTIHCKEIVRPNNPILSLTNQFQYRLLSQENVYVIITYEIQFNKLKQLLDERLDLSSPASPYYCVISPLGTTPEMLPLFYQKTVAVLHHLFFYAQPNGYLLLEDLPDSDLLDRFPIIERTQELIDSISQSSPPAGLDDFISDYESYLRVTLPQQMTVCTMISNCYQQVMHELESTYSILSHEMPSDVEFSTKLYQKDYLYESMDQLKESFLLIASLINDTNQHSPCTKLCHYIKQNYMHSIKLETISAQFGYNSIYLGRIFKQEMGLSFNSYLTQVRLEHAKELLEMGFAVQEASLQSGIQNIDYFTKKFKEMEGCLPSEYRKRGN